MFRISSKTCCGFTLGEILIMAAMNSLEIIRPASGGRISTSLGVNERGHLSANESLRTKVNKALSV
jgi:hypothetical protein